MHHRGLGCTKVLAPENPTPVPWEVGRFGMDRAVEDLEAIRKDLLGASAPWFVYGISYGSLLAQKYAFKYPDMVAGLILDSTAYDSDEISITRHRFFDLAVNQDRSTPLRRGNRQISRRARRGFAHALHVPIQFLRARFSVAALPGEHSPSQGPGGGPSD
jgi:pimeloyl-ACP methyl ester carboxylesterase